MSTKYKGTILVEVLLAVAIFGIMATTIMGGFVSARDGKVTQKQTLLAKGYMDQAVEALRSIREQGWASISNGTYYPKLTGSTWSLAVPADPAGESIDGFNRKIVISDVYRNTTYGNPGFGNIVNAGGSVDPATKKAAITVLWGSSVAQNISTTVYLTRHEFNNSFIHTKVGDFDGGNLMGTVVEGGAPENDGSIKIAPGGYGNWCKPSESITTVDLSRQGVPTSVWAFETTDNNGNRVFAGTGENASGLAFTNTKLTGNDPIASSYLGGYDSKGSKINGIFGDKDYAYVTTDKSSTALMILDLNQFANPPVDKLYKKVGSYSSGDNKDAKSVFVDGDTTYFTTNKLYTLNTSDKTNPTLKKTMTLDGIGVRVRVVNKIAYIGISGSSTKLEIIDYTDPDNPVRKGKLVDSSLADVRDIYVNEAGTRVYMVTAASSSKPEFFIVNTYNKNSPALISGATHETGMDPTAVTLVGYESLAIIVGKNGTDTHPEYQVVTVYDENNIQFCTSNGGTGKLRVPSGIHDISSLVQSDGHTFSYVVTGDTSAELKIIEGGLGGGGGGSGSMGVFESEFTSPPFSGNVQFNRFDVDATLNGGEVRLWLASYQPQSGSCSYEGTGQTYPYVGPDGTGDTYFTGSGTIPFSSSVTGYSNPAKCLRYKMRLYAGSDSPEVKSILFNYSL